MNIMENCPKGLKYAFSGRKEIPPVSYRTSALWGRCPALTPLLHLITPSRASGTADHVRSLDDQLIIKYACFRQRPITHTHSAP